MKNLLRIIGVASAFLLAGGQAKAANVLGDIVSLEILDGWRGSDGSRMAAIRFTLAPGWKTYWRAPGEAGIPPSFDFAGSRNIRAVVFHWPRPDVFDFNGMQTIGYERELVLPVQVWPSNPAAPVFLVTEVEFGVCSTICVPAIVKLDSELRAGQTPQAPQIKAALAQRPRTGSEAGVSGYSCRLDPIEDGLRLTVTIDVPSPGNDETVVIESADRALWVDDAETVRNGPRLTAVTEIFGLHGQPVGINRSDVTITMLSKGQAVELHGCPAG